MKLTRDKLVEVDHVKPWAYGPRESILGAPGSHLVTSEVPQLSTFSNTHRITCHRLVMPMIQRVMRLCELAGLLDTFTSWDGCYNDRSVRGNALTASTHAFGAAFDFNADYNRLGTKPTSLGVKGSLLPVVGIFEKCGFGWGGWWNRPDGMHFEPSKIMKQSDLPELDLESMRWTVSVKGKDMLAFDFDGRNWVWVRDFAEALGVPVSKSNVDVTVGTYTYSTTPKMVDGKTYLPISSLAQGQHLTTRYNADEKHVWVD